MGWTPSRHQARVRHPAPEPPSDTGSHHPEPWTLSPHLSRSQHARGRFSGGRIRGRQYGSSSYLPRVRIEHFEPLRRCTHERRSNALETGEERRVRNDRADPRGRTRASDEGEAGTIRSDSTGKTRTGTPASDNALAQIAGSRSVRRLDGHRGCSGDSIVQVAGIVEAGRAARLGVARAATRLSVTAGCRKGGPKPSL